MSTTAPADPFALPAASARAIAPRTARETGTPPAASKASAPRGARSASGPAVPGAATGTPLVQGGARELLRRLVPHVEALAALGITDDEYEAWDADGRAWPTWARPDGERLADAADVLAVLELAGGAA